MAERKENHQKGSRGEKAAARFLEQQGYAVLERNYTRRVGEIDLICRQDDTIVFVEVKLRRDIGHGLPIEAVGKTKQRRIISTAKLYAAEHDLFDYDMRFDVIEVVVDDQNRLWVRHVPGAFMENRRV